jgi:hypothetical protein
MNLNFSISRQNALEEDASLAGLSARERNRLKRKARMNKDKSKERYFSLHLMTL